MNNETALLLFNMDNIPILDIDHFTAFVGEDPVYQKEMIALYKEQATFSLENLKLAFKTNNNEDWYDSAHLLKGLASFSGTKRLQYHCEIAQNNSHVCRAEKQILLDTINNEIINSFTAFEEFLK